MAKGGKASALKAKALPEDAGSAKGSWRRPLGAVVVAVAAVVLGVQQGWTRELARRLSNESADGEQNAQGEAASRAAYTRRPPIIELMPANASETYGVERASDLPFVKFLGGPPMSERRERPMGARFRNFFRRDLTMWWDDGSEEGVYSGVIRAGGFSATNTYTTHTFHFRDKNSGEDVASLTMHDDRHLMILGPDEDDVETINSKEYKDALAEEIYLKEFYDKNGFPWLSYYPPHKPVLPFWPADFVGQVHKVRSFVGYFTSETEQSSEPVDLKIKVVSTSPRVLLIEDLLSEFEIQHIVAQGLGVVRRSSVGSAHDGFESETRTSDNGWLSRHKTKLLDTVYDRFADALMTPDKYMREGRGGNLEQLQFVRYKRSQKYDAHHDFGNTGRPNQRFSTLFIYLQTPEEGGATSFPKAQPEGIMVKPPPGSAALFYSMTPDGNGDDYSLHAGMPVTKGVKLGCNLWSWTPSYE